MRQLLMFILLFSSSLIVACSDEPEESVLLYQENNEIIGEEREEIIGEIDLLLLGEEDRTNEAAEEIFISPMERSGESVTPPPGRYWIGAGEFDGTPQSGRVLVYDEDDQLLIEEVIDSFYGVSSVTVSLNGQQTVHADGMDHLLITPVDTQFSNELTAGIWTVGKDIEPGNYTVYAGSEQIFGYLLLYRAEEEPRVFEILNNPSESTIDVDLEEDDIIQITGAGYLEFR